MEPKRVQDRCRPAVAKALRAASLLAAASPLLGALDPRAFVSGDALAFRWRPAPASLPSSPHRHDFCADSSAAAAAVGRRSGCTAAGIVGRPLIARRAMQEKQGAVVMEKWERKSPDMRLQQLLALNGQQLQDMANWIGTEQMFRRSLPAIIRGTIQAALFIDVRLEILGLEQRSLAIREKWTLDREAVVHYKSGDHSGTRLAPDLDIGIHTTTLKTSELSSMVPKFWEKGLTVDKFAGQKEALLKDIIHAGNRRWTIITKDEYMIDLVFMNLAHDDHLPDRKKHMQWLAKNQWVIDAVRCFKLAFHKSQSISGYHMENLAHKIVMSAKVEGKALNVKDLFKAMLDQIEVGGPQFREVVEETLEEHENDRKFEEALLMRVQSMQTNIKSARDSLTTAREARGLEWRARG
mmetsp:Transcript_93814/g.268884  ORF Transcript_93814/g.268884 Transcript_93814/m.268884 type:complete len:409 (-) Transcript_93814:173-1399(-)